MTQLYVGNLSTDADDKVLRAVFGKYGPIRETIMKNGYAFIEYESSTHADAATSELNGAEILGSHLIVEPSHQQRITKQTWNSDNSKKILSPRVEVTDIPMCLTWESVETQLASIGTIVKSEHDIDDYGNLTGYVLYETVDQAQRAELAFKGDENMFRVAMWDERRPASAGAIRGRKVSLGSMSGPMAPSKQNNDFPLRIVVPTDMIGAIIGKDGATIRAITVSTKARVDVHRRETLGNSSTVHQAEKTITINGSPECCTEACHMIMKIMQAELLSQTGYTSSLQGPLDRLPSVPLKILSHNDLIGRVIGKGGNTLKRIMQESGTKITISKLKELTPQKPERTITIMGTVDNCKKAESLISAKLRASYENDMAHLIPQQQQALTPVKYTQPNASASLFSGLSISSDQVEHFVPSSTRVNPIAAQSYSTSTSYQVPGSGGISSTETLELSGLQGFTLPANPHDTTLVASQLGNPNPPSKTSSNPSNLLSPTLSGPPDLSINLSEDLRSSDVDPLAHSMGHLSMGGRQEPQKVIGKSRRSSIPTIMTQPMWVSSQTTQSTSQEDMLSPVGTGHQVFPFFEDNAPREAWQPVPPGRSDNVEHTYLHQSEEDLLANTFYNPMQEQGFSQPFFQPSSAPPYVEPTNFHFGGGGTVMTSKLLGSPIKVKPEEEMVGTPPYGWGSPMPQNMGSAKTNLTFSFDFPHYSRSSQVSNNGVNTSNAFNLMA
jgi:predicted RNA-binding protein YlqC (UPF0109 family)